MAANNFIGLRISDERKEIYRALADAENRSISNFIVNRVDSTITGQYPTNQPKSTKGQIRAIKAFEILYLMNNIMHWHTVFMEKIGV